MAKAKKMVYFFGGRKSEGKSQMKALLGGKGANLAEMCSLGLPVPGGFTLTTEACAQYDAAGGKWPTGLAGQVDKNLKKLEKLTGKTFGKGKNPLLVSVRSGAAVSMPGMMDTVLNLGLNDETLQALIDLTGNERFAWDAYRRFMQMFGDVVLGMEHHDFEHALQKVKDARGAQLDTDLCVDGLKAVVKEYQRVYKKSDKQFPQDARKQLDAAVAAVFGSWNNPRAIKYRELNDIRGLLGTAVNVQAMVFGNLGSDSATGVAFTRDPSTGEHKYFYGEYLINAQGEDVVAGIRTPQQLTLKGSREWAKSQKIDEKIRKTRYPSLQETMPKCFKQLDAIRVKLEKHYRDMQDVEFTIEKDILYMLQTRSGKRTAAAAVKIAVDMMGEKLITEKEALCRVDPKRLDQLLHPVFIKEAEDKANKITVGLNASPGAATGQVVFSAEDAEAWEIQGKTTILCRTETSPEDIGGMAAAKGILTARGGMTSHAAVVARGMGTCCVAGAGDIQMDYKAKQFTCSGTTVKEGDWISLNGSTGAVYIGKVETVEPKLTGPFGAIMKLADKYRKLGVRTNADTPHDTRVAVRFGAEGIGLTRTEHMFFEGERIVSFRRFILVAEEVKRLREQLDAAEGTRAEDLRRQLAEPEAQYNQALSELLPLQRKDFIGIFKALKGRPATIRLLDPPLHEFLPHDDAGQKTMADAMDVPIEKIKAAVESLHEFNPMLGHRGCRLGIAYPEITATQARAIFEAAFAVKGAKPEIMIPLIGSVKELTHQKKIVLEALDQVLAKKRMKKPPFEYKIGTMIEVPRGALTADKVAKEAEFFSFGTNDLTQMACGFSRDDAGKFLGQYVRMGIFEADPFQSLDTSGVGELVRIAVTRGRATRKDLKLGICGEHGGDPASVAFCNEVGLDYVSCSPYRVPIARLAAAQAAVKQTPTKKAKKKSNRKKR